MKTIITLLSFLLLSCATVQANPLKTIEDLDLVRYSGSWNQIALLPNSFQKNCFEDTVATYEVLPPNRKGISNLKVTNTCVKKDGETQTGVARGRVNPKYDSTAKLQVSFLLILDRPVWLVSGNYWVIDIGDNYEYVVIGEPKRKFAWILARDLSLPTEKLLEIKELLTNKGYNPCDLIMSRNDEFSPEELPNLCEFLD